MRGFAVIGANYGDEGKGLFTDYLAYNLPPAKVVRFNGGAQAGHTVTDPSGKRHVFSHFGAGTLAGAGTVLSEHFIVDPFSFVEELSRLKKIGVDPYSTEIHIDARVSTPIDTILNQIIEDARGNERHGSCGFGINETVERSRRTDFAITFRDLISNPGLPVRLVRKLNRIINEWVPYRLMQLGFSYLWESPIIRKKFNDSEILDSWLDCVDDMISSVEWFYDYEEVFENEENIIFEGAQGLLLDEDGIDFPHVTRSRTGLHNVMEIYNQLGQIFTIDTIFVTRCYLTRHGRGPLPNEVDGKIYPGIVDETNIHNQWQESLRFAPLDPMALVGRVFDEWRNFHNVIEPHIGITCLDQADRNVLELVKYIRDLSELNIIESWGPTRETVRYAKFLNSA